MVVFNGVKQFSVYDFIVQNVIENKYSVLNAVESC